MTVGERSSGLGGQGLVPDEVVDREPFLTKRLVIQGSSQPRPCGDSVDRSNEKGASMQGLKRIWAGTVVGMTVAAATLVAPSAAVAANPDVNHFEFSDEFTDTDFCGTGVAVDISTAGHGTEFLAPNQPVDYWNTVEGDNVFTNPLTGKTVDAHFANRSVDTTVSGDPEGLHIHEFTNQGLPQLLRTEHGAVLIRDAGYLVFRVTFDGDEVISSEIVVDRGPHPDAESDFALFCEVMTDALALS